MNRVKTSVGQIHHPTRSISCQKLFHLTIRWISAALLEIEAGCCLSVWDKRHRFLLQSQANSAVAPNAKTGMNWLVP